MLRVIDKIKDETLGVEYDYCKVNAIELSKYLRNNNPNYEKYNFQNKETSQNDFLNSGLYEYQNFFLYKIDGEYKLLDGFRRLLWHDNIPNREIFVRVYENLDDSELIKLMVNLNNFKFFSKSQKYYDRGFAMFLDLFFNLDITENYKIFDDYMSYYKLMGGFNDKSSVVKKEGENLALKVIDFLTSKHFISDFKFILDVKNRGLYHGIQFTSLVRKLRGLNENIELNVDKFIDELKKNEDYYQMSLKYHYYDNRGFGDRDTDKVNSLIQIYENIIKKNNNIEVELTYFDKLKICDDLVSELKNKKSGYKQLSKRSDNYHSKEVKEIVEHSKNGFDIEFKVVCFPDDSEVGRWSASKIKSDIEYGLHEDFKLVKIYSKSHLMSTWKELSITNGDKEISHFRNRYESLSVMGRPDIKCKVFYKLK